MGKFEYLPILKNVNFTVYNIFFNFKVGFV
jgi:hypothetical protein